MSSIKFKGRTYGGVPTISDGDHITVSDGTGTPKTLQQVINMLIGAFVEPTEQELDEIFVDEEEEEEEAPE